MDNKTTLRPEVLAKYPNEIFIETGTYDGSGCLVAVQAGFKKVVSFEIDPGMFKIATERLKGVPQADLILGDSMTMLPKLLAFIGVPCTFWLDAHSPNVGHSVLWGQSPILYELAAIAQHPVKSHTILIDDLDLLRGGIFGSLTEADLMKSLREVNPNYRFVAEDGNKPGSVLVAVP